MNQTLMDNLVWLKKCLGDDGVISKIEFDIVAQAIKEIENKDSHIKRLIARIEELNDLAEERSE